MDKLYSVDVSGITSDFQTKTLSERKLRNFFDSVVTEWGSDYDAWLIDMQRAGLVKPLEDRLASSAEKIRMIMQACIPLPDSCEDYGYYENYTENICGHELSIGMGLVRDEDELRHIFCFFLDGELDDYAGDYTPEEIFSDDFIFDFAKDWEKEVSYLEGKENKGLILQENALQEKRLVQIKAGSALLCRILTDAPANLLEEILWNGGCFSGCFEEGITAVIREKGYHVYSAAGMRSGNDRLRFDLLDYDAHALRSEAIDLQKELEPVLKEADEGKHSVPLWKNKDDKILQYVWVESRLKEADKYGVKWRFGEE